MKKLLTSILGVYILFILSSCGLPDGDFIKAYDSPDQKYTINIYLCNGGATVDFAIRGELVNNETASVKNIYWNYHESEAYVEWIDNDTVKINEQTLNIHTDIYDFRTE